MTSKSMATATEYTSAGFPRSPPLSVARSPDTASPIYPERAIRPLPRSRLKSKLSPEQRESIVYPPEPPPLSPALNFSLPENGAVHSQMHSMNGDAHHFHHAHEPSFGKAAHHHCTCGEEGDSGDDEVEFDHPDYRYSTAPLNGTAANLNGSAVKPLESVQRRLIEASRTSSKPPPPGSTVSSADGYESFENTSNKKKRKIPLSATSSMHQSQLSAEMASMGISAHPEVADDLDHPLSSTVTTVGSGTGISGAGRGRYGRQDARTRRPLGSSNLNTLNGFGSRVATRGNDEKEDSTGGIISQAIKTAAEQGPLTPARGRDTLPSSAGSSTTPKTQFTFTCESDSAKTLSRHGPELPRLDAAGTPTPSRTGPPNARGGAQAQGTQTAPVARSAHVVNRPPPPPLQQQHPVASVHPQQQQQAPPPPPPPKPRPRRNPSKEYAFQAANRKKQQQYQNYHHRPKIEDMWICEFCEYEDIYGAPPYAMIRRYEIKDRQERKKAAEKRRLLEKAKLKGRKNKKNAAKGGKPAHGANGVANSGQPATQDPSQHYDPHLPPADGDEYYEDGDEYGDEYEPVGPDEQYPHDYYPPPAPGGVPPAAAAGGGPRAQHI